MFFWFLKATRDTVSQFVTVFLHVSFLAEILMTFTMCPVDFIKACSPVGTRPVKVFSEKQQLLCSSTPACCVFVFAHSRLVRTTLFLFGL